MTSYVSLVCVCVCVHVSTLQIEKGKACSYNLHICKQYLYSLQCVTNLNSHNRNNNVSLNDTLDSCLC